MSDKILLQNMMFYGFHGVYEYEREQGQKFYLDVELTADLSVPSTTDNVVDTIDYTVIYSSIKEIMENHRFQLLEAAGAHIAEVILKTAMVSAVTVKIRKPSVPIPGSLDYVQVEITRSK
jgi:dihydroneopterin aldolase